MNISAITSVAGTAAASEPAAVRLGARPLTGAALRNAPEAVQRAEVASQFEAIMVRQLLSKTMTSMLGSESGAAGNVYGDMLTDTFAQQLTRGGGFGLAHLLAQQLAPRASHAAPNSSPVPPAAH